jgi:RimJ/RimL family protein N-acetyltransferase
MGLFSPTLPDRIETPRLTLRWPRPDDAPFLVPLLGEWEVARWLANVPAPFTMTDAQDWVRTASSLRRDGKIMVAVVVRHGDDRPIGGAELNLVRRETGYWIGVPYQRRGYGRETLDALLRMAFAQFKLPHLAAATMPENLPSRSLLEGAGFVLRGVEPFDFGLRGGVLPGCIHTITAEQWQRRQGRSA